MPIEYANYKPFDQQIDWASVSTDVSKKALEIGEDRKNRKAALDKMKSDYELKLAEQEAFKTEDVTAKWQKTADQGRELLFKANKDLKSRKISETEYKNIVNNLTSYTDKLADHATALDKDVQAYIARQQVDEKTGKAQGGAAELSYLERLGKLADLKNKDFNVLPDGRMSIDQKKDDGTVESSFDLMSLNKAENRFAPRVYVDELTSNIVKDWAKWSEFQDLGRGAWSNIEDIRQNPAIRDALYMAVKSVNSTPKNTLSVLVDNGAIKQPLFAYSVEEVAAMKAKAEQDLIDMRTSQGISATITDADRADIENRIIRMNPNDGEPILTKEQKELADQTVERSIQMKMGHEETGGGKENWTRASSGGGDGGGGSTNKDNTNYYPEMRRAWDLGGTTGASQLTALAQGKALFKFVKGGLQVYEQSQDTRKKGEWIPIGEPVKDLASIQKYIYPENNKNFDIHRQQYVDEFGTGNKESKKPKFN